VIFQALLYTVIYEMNKRISSIFVSYETYLKIREEISARPHHIWFERQSSRVASTKLLPSSFNQSD